MFCVCVIVIVCVGMAGDYAKFGLLSYIRRGVNNRIFTNFLNIIQITQLLYNTFPAQNFISRHLRWTSDNWDEYQTTEMNIRQLTLGKMCLSGSISYFYRFDLLGSVRYVPTIHVSTSLNHYKYWCDFGCFFANNVIRALFRKNWNLFG